MQTRGRYLRRDLEFQNAPLQVSRDLKLSDTVEKLIDSLVSDMEDVANIELTIYLKERIGRIIFLSF